MKLSTMAGFAAFALAASSAARPVLADETSASPSPASTAAAAKVLDTIVTTAERRTTTIRAASRETYVVTSDDLAKFAEPTLAQALSLVPGLFVKRNGAFGGVESLLARGASSEQTL